MLWYGHIRDYEWNRKLLQAVETISLSPWVSDSDGNSHSKNTRVCTAPGDRVPGPRSYALLEPVTQFPWRDAIDSIEEVGSVDAYNLSMRLSREGLICGPSSGFNLQGECSGRNISDQVDDHRFISAPCEAKDRRHIEKDGGRKWIYPLCLRLL